MALNRTGMNGDDLNAEATTTTYTDRIRRLEESLFNVLYGTEFDFV